MCKQILPYYNRNNTSVLADNSAVTNVTPDCLYILEISHELIPNHYQAILSYEFGVREVEEGRGEEGRGEEGRGELSRLILKPF